MTQTAEPTTLEIGKSRVRKEDDIDNLSMKVAVSAIWGVIETRDDHLVWAKGA